MGTLPKTDQVSVEVDATPEQVWTLLTDITRAGEWSHETQGGEWLDGATGAAPGARFRGRNENGRVEVEPPVRGAHGRRAAHDQLAHRPDQALPRQHHLDLRARAHRRPAAASPSASRWCMLGPIMDRLFYAIIPAHRDRSRRPGRRRPPPRRARRRPRRHVTGGQPIDFWPSIVSRRMSAWPACWAVSATMCTNTRRAVQLAPGSNHGAAGSGCDRSRSTVAQHLVGAVRDLLVVGQDPGERLALEHPEAVGVGVVAAAGGLHRLGALAR